MVKPQPTLFPFPFQLSLDSIELLEERKPYRMVVLRQRCPLTDFQSRHLRLKKASLRIALMAQAWILQGPSARLAEECQGAVEDEYAAAPDVIEVLQPRMTFHLQWVARSRNRLFALAALRSPENARMPSSAPTLGSREKLENGRARRCKALQKLEKGTDENGSI
jgi:hypothetical protein